ncbi:nitronate monooxygenase [Frigoribacterium sp. 2-23]|uniref:nitronate monooxygenase n=1 Tax=Frigoribacterium sp. 2-23 TaxID=3415006 RepID=UPI003C6F460C
MAPDTSLPPRPHVLPAPLVGLGVVWVAPMAGGPSRPELVIAAARAGSFAQLAAGYKSAAAMVDEIMAVRAAGVTTFGVNLFVPNVHPVVAEEYERYARALRSTARRLGVDDPAVAPREDDDEWDAKIAALVADPVPVVSFTFGLPRASVVSRLHEVGTVLLQTVTSVEEAVRSEAAGVDVLVVQGWGAGGHSGVWAPGAQPEDVPLPELVARVVAATTLPVAAAGGIAGRRDVDKAVAAGASAVVVGTAVLRSPESGASGLHKEALADEQYDETVLTRAFTGRPARALVNRFVRDHEPEAVSGYPALHHLTKPLRVAATAAGDASALNLWAGQGWRGARDAPVAEILADLAGPEPRHP